ncbi:MAG: hypothetical protein V4772_18540 [Pseudomonadota bacterium]
MNKPNDRKPGKKRIMVQLWRKVADAIDRDFKAMHIKRDGYLNDLFTREIENLDSEVKFRNSDKVRRHFRERPLPDRVKLNLDLDETLVQRMDEVLKQRNIPRDSFVNRVLFFLVATDAHLNFLDIEYEKETYATAKPIGDVKGLLLDPFFHIRSKNDGDFYTLTCFADAPFGKKGPNLFSLNVAISDEFWSLMTIDLEDLLGDFGMYVKGEAGHAAN